MWFNQMTCDNCYRPLESTGRHNRYYFCKILEFRKVTSQEYRRNYNYFNNIQECRFNYDTSPYCANGYVFCYKTEPLTSSNYSTWFCSKECAVQAAVLSNSMVFYYDEEERSVAFFTPQIVEINNAICEKEHTPLLMMDWKENEWFQKRSDYKDLHSFGSETKYPEFSTKLCNIVKPTANLLNDYKKLVLDSEFEHSYWGSSSDALKQHIQKNLKNFIESVDINFGRRLMIEWFITDKSGKFAGFIHLTCMYPALPYKWVVEFGLEKKYRGKGIMKTILNGIADWAYKNGCEEIYAISEDFNVASHSTLKKVHYEVTETKTTMSDEYGGNRPMRIFKINLKIRRTIPTNDSYSKKVCTQNVNDELIDDFPSIDDEENEPNNKTKSTLINEGQNKYAFSESPSTQNNTKTSKSDNVVYIFGGAYGGCLISMILLAILFSVAAALSCLDININIGEDNVDKIFYFFYSGPVIGLFYGIWKYYRSK